MTNTTINQQIDAHIEANVDYWLGQLARLCAHPGISAQNVRIAECAELVATMLREQGCTAEVMPSNSYPMVYGEGNRRSTAAPTLLFYLHYDVQPPDPLELWESPPFELTRRDDIFYARGVSDDKGHIICRLAALAAVRDVPGLSLVSAGVGFPGSLVHAPNENMRLDNFINGTRHMARIIERFGRSFW